MTDCLGLRPLHALYAPVIIDGMFNQTGTILTALYDGNCIICRSTCETLRALDWRKRIEFVDLHKADAGSARFAEFTGERLLSEIHVLDAEGQLYAGFAGMRRLLKEMPLGFPLWLLLQLPGSDALGRRAYRFIARRRYRINRMLGVELPDCAEGDCKMLL